MKLINFVVVIVLISSGFSNGEKLRCEFNDVYFIDLTMYSCAITSLDNSNNSMIITGHTGTHKRRKTDSKVKGLWINGTNTKYIPTNIGNLFNLTSFAMSNAQLAAIKSQDFVGMENLEILNLNKNKLSSVSSDAFATLTKLKKISLSSNQIEEISNGVFQHNLQLEQIRLGGNKIKFIGSGSFDGLTKLNYVDLRENKCINKFYSGSSKIVQVKKDIQIKCNNSCDQRTSTQNSTDASTELNCEFKNEWTGYSCDVTSLDNTYNNMIITGHSGIHNAISTDTDVKRIYVHDTNTKYIPKNVGLLFNLTMFFMETTELFEIKSQDFNGMHNLESLSFSDNRLTCIPTDAFSTLIKLFYINLVSNQIEEIQNGVFANNLQLETIYLQGNKIKFLGSTLFHGLKELEVVSLSGNICIKNVYYGRTRIIDLKNDIKMNCTNPNEIPTMNPIEKLHVEIDDQIFLIKDELIIKFVDATKINKKKLIKILTKTTEVEEESDEEYEEE